MADNLITLDIPKVNTTLTCLCHSEFYGSSCLTVENLGKHQAVRTINIKLNWFSFQIFSNIYELKFVGQTRICLADNWWVQRVIELISSGKKTITLSSKKWRAYVDEMASRDWRQMDRNRTAWNSFARRVDALSRAPQRKSWWFWEWRSHISGSLCCVKKGRTLYHSPVFYPWSMTPSRCHSAYL